MNESLLQFIWQWTLYRPEQLFTTDGQPVTVVMPGTLNRDAGPDFLTARVRIGSTLLVGNVELHLQTSAWLKHGHQSDPAYSNVILHVVLHHDTEALPNGIPVLELAPHIPDYVLDNYRSLVQTTVEVPCAQHLAKVSGLALTGWLSRMLAERWEGRKAAWSGQLAQAKGDWLTLLYWRLAAALGFKANATPFMLLAQSLPVNVLQRHHGRLFDLEALLFGQAGMLDGTAPDDYVEQLQNNYAHLRRKYGLEPIASHLWKFLRMRPANFPSLRIAQFAALLHRLDGQLSRLLETETPAALYALLNVKASDYWTTHYRFGSEPGKASPKYLGDTAAQLLIINVIAPIRFLSAGAHGNAVLQEAALDLMDDLPAEHNHILEVWKKLGIRARHAGQGQALLQLFQEYCAPRRCLECAVGLSILKRRPQE